MATPTRWVCPKCNCPTRDTGEIRASGGFWSSFFDVSTNRFAYVSCTRCKYTEFYKTNLSGLSKVIDFLGGG